MSSNGSLPVRYGPKLTLPVEPQPGLLRHSPGLRRFFQDNFRADDNIPDRMGQPAVAGRQMPLAMQDR